MWSAALWRISSLKPNWTSIVLPVVILILIFHCIVIYVSASVALHVLLSWWNHSQHSCIHLTRAVLIKVFNVFLGHCRGIDRGAERQSALWRGCPLSMAPKQRALILYYALPYNRCVTNGQCAVSDRNRACAVLTRQKTRHCLTVKSKSVCSHSYCILCPTFVGQCLGVDQGLG